MNVQIIKDDSGEVVAQYIVNIGTQNYTPSDNEYYEQAWKCAEDDGVVKSSDKNKYRFSFAE